MLQLVSLSNAMHARAHQISSRSEPSRVRGVVWCSSRGPGRRGGEPCASTRKAVETVVPLAETSSAPPEQVPSRPFYPGGTIEGFKAGSPLTLYPKGLPCKKQVVILRHGSSEWNEQGRIQGNSNESQLTSTGISQARRCRDAISRIPFDKCFTSPITRARQTADIVWQGRQGEMVELEDLQEVHLGFLQGMRNVDASVMHKELFKVWREDPSHFEIDGHMPIPELWPRAEGVWRQILEHEGDSFLVVSHKSLSRALLCIALGLGPDFFRCVDINNGGLTTIRVNELGQPMVLSMNQHVHMSVDGVYY